MNSTCCIITAEELSGINNNPVWQYNYSTIACRSESVLLWFQQLESHVALQSKQNNTAMWKNIMPSSLSNACLCKDIHLVWWLKAEKGNAIFFHNSIHQCKNVAINNSVAILPTKEKAVILNRSLCQECTRSSAFTSGLPGSEIVAPATEVWINTSIQAQTNNHKITCNPRYTAGMPIILDLSK